MTIKEESKKDLSKFDMIESPRISAAESSRREIKKKKSLLPKKSFYTNQMEELMFGHHSLQE